MIEKLHIINDLDPMRTYAPSNHELTKKINEIIDKVNELEKTAETLQPSELDQHIPRIE